MHNDDQVLYGGSVSKAEYTHYCMLCSQLTRQCSVEDVEHTSATSSFFGALAGKKLARFREYATLYPEATFIFVGDTGQACPETTHRCSVFRIVIAGVLQAWTWHTTSCTMDSGFLRPSVVTSSVLVRTAIIMSGALAPAHLAYWFTDMLTYLRIPPAFTSKHRELG